MNPEVNKSPLPGVKILLLGPTGTGKTFSIKTFFGTGIKPCALFSEPGFEVLGDTPKEKLAWRYINPTTESLDMILDKALKVSTMTYKALTEVYDANRGRDNRFIEFVKSLNNYIDERTGEDLGKVSEWGTNRVLIIDSLSGLNLMVMQMVIGSKPAKTQAEWGLAMDNLEGLINWMCTSLRCHVVLIAHAEREVDEVTGGSNIMASTLGRKLAPKLPRYFSDVILSQRIGKEFKWSTAAAGADLKARNLPVAEGLAPSFAQVIESWQKRGGIIE